MSQEEQNVLTSEEVTYDIIQTYGVVGKNARGWTKEVNLITWNQGLAKVDIRDWDPDHVKMSKGIRLTFDETEELKKILNNIDFGIADTLLQ